MGREAQDLKGAKAGAERSVRVEALRVLEEVIPDLYSSS